MTRSGFTYNKSALPARPSAGIVLLLGSLAAVPAVTTDMYLPSLPEVAAELGADISSAQATITISLIGGAIGQVLTGALSDRWGRKTPVLVGLAFHIVTSFLCLIVSGIMPFLAMRLLQGMGNAAASVTVIAVIRDLWTGATASRVMSRLLLIIGLSPLLAPTAGGFIAHWWGWRAVFLVLMLAGMALWAAVWWFLPETLPVEKRLSGGIMSLLRSYINIFHDVRFFILAVIPAFSLAALLSYISVSPFVLEEIFGLKGTSFALVFALLGTGIIVGAQLNAALVTRFSPLNLLRFAAVLEVFLMGWLLTVCITGWGGLIVFLISLWLVLGTMQLMVPNAVVLALARHGDTAGTAAAVIGAMQPLVAGFVAPLVGVVGGGIIAMALVMSGAILVAVLAVLAISLIGVFK